MKLNRTFSIASRLVHAMLAALLAFAAGAAIAQTAKPSFDHLKTGFALTGTHIAQRCESCHQLGVFKGTPRDCASCHTPGARLARANVVMPDKHIPTQLGCDSCHNTQSFTGAKFSHTGVQPGSCGSCHGTGRATGKSAGHVVTSAACDTCHRTTAWRPASAFNHVGVVAGTCATCHGVTAKGKTALHIPTTVPTSMPSCDSCHRAGYTSFVPARLHGSVAVNASCATCHTGAFSRAVGKPNTPVHANVTVCESCHKSTATWLGAKVDHTPFNALTNCASCHNGTSATGRPAATHIPVGATNCIACHNTTAWRPTTWDHTQVPVAAQCSTCHSGANPPADARHATHVPYQSVAGLVAPNCDTCHRSALTAWKPAKVHSNVAVIGGCASCHTGAFAPAVGRSAGHVAIGTAACEACHRSTVSWATTGKPDHLPFTAATNCTTAGCHGSGASGKSSAHIPTGSIVTTCGSCHGTASWRPATVWNHTQLPVAGQCSTCHSGLFPPADGRTVAHVPYAALGAAVTNCDTCHKGGTVAWRTAARVHANLTVATNCVSCHTGQYPPAVGKSTGHVATNAACETCHTSTLTWLGARINHSTFTAATNCASCHTGGTGATGKTANHIPVGVTNCFSCHGTVAWLPSKWNHTQVPVAAQCATCHTGSFPPADGRSTTHIPHATVTASAAANCDACHTISTVWTGARLHSKFTLSTQCANCHMGNYAPGQRKPTNTTHATITGNCESCHKSTTNWLVVTFAHNASNAVGTGTCDTCHAPPGTARTKHAGHIPVPAGTAKCDSCHRSQASFTTAVTMNHAVVTTATCKSCHSGGHLTQGVVGALAKPTNHIPEAQLLNGAAMDCKACHTGTTAWTTLRMNHNASLGGGSGWCKGCHTSGQAFLGTMQKKSLTHERKTPLQIDCSESGCHRPLGNRGSPYSSW
jgi:Cytochrome c7 and related cytochrome c